MEQPTADKKAGVMTIWQAAGTLGVGSVLVLLIVPRIMSSGEQQATFIQDKFIGTLEKNAEKSTELISETKGLADKVDKLVDATDETNDILRPLTKQLTNVAEAVTEQVEQRDAENESESPP